MPRSRSRSPGRRGGGGGGAGGGGGVERSHRRSRSRSREHRRRPRSPEGASSSRHRKHSSRSPPSSSSSHRRRDRSKSPDIFNKPSSSKSGRSVGEPEVTTGATNPDLLSPEMQIPVDGEVTQEAVDMIQLMGFSGFDTSKGKAHSDGSVKAHAASIQVKRKYRQYMNRRGGFNRPLDHVA